MKPVFFKNLSWLLLLNMVVKPVWIFGIDRKVQNMVGHGEYGTYFSILNLSVILSFITDAGISNMMNRQLALQQGVAVRKLLLFKIYLSFAYVVALVFVAWVTGISRWDIVVPVLGIQLVTSFLTFFRSIVTAGQLFYADAWISVGDKLGMIVIAGSLLYLPFTHAPFSLNQFLYLQTGCLSGAVIITLVVLRKERFVRGAANENLGRIIKATFPFTLIILLMSLHYRLDGFLLERLHRNGAWEAGVYASAYRLLDAGSMIGYLATSFLVPFMARHIKDATLLEQTILPVRHVLLLTGAAAVAVICVYAPWLQELLYGAANRYNALVLTLCLASLPAIYLTHIYGSVLTAKGAFTPLITVLLVSVLLNAGINAVLIPAYGAEGCCVAALISQYVCSTLLCMVATKRARISFQPVSFMAYIATGLLLFLLFRYGGAAGFPKVILLVTGSLATGLVMFVLLHLSKKRFLSFI